MTKWLGIAAVSELPARSTILFGTFDTATCVPAGALLLLSTVVMLNSVELIRCTEYEARDMPLTLNAPLAAGRMMGSELASIQLGG